MRPTPSLLIVFMFGGLASCEEAMSVASPTGRQGTVLAGMWGGEHIRLEVTSLGGQVEYDCAHGSISGQLAADREGRFDVEGTHVRERGGPERENEQPANARARYVGRVDARTMTLTVSLPATNETVGRFTLTHGRQAVLRKCL